MLQHLAACDLTSLTRVHETIEMTLEQLSEWIAEARNRRHVGNLTRLLNTQTQLLACQHRVLAVARLAEIVADRDAAHETVRRACNDLLRIRLIDQYREDEWASRPPPPAPDASPSNSPASEARVLAALEEFGQLSREMPGLPAQERAPDSTNANRSTHTQPGRQHRPDMESQRSPSADRSRNETDTTPQSLQDFRHNPAQPEPVSSRPIGSQHSTVSTGQCGARELHTSPAGDSATAVTRGQPPPEQIAADARRAVHGEQPPPAHPPRPAFKRWW